MRHPRPDKPHLMRFREIWFVVLSKQRRNLNDVHALRWTNRRNEAEMEGFPWLKNLKL